MEKRGDITPGRTPDTERVLGDSATKTADASATQRQINQLDDDLFHRMANKAKPVAAVQK
jgi:hypothetical protein